jgi:glutamate dehydrogenase (NAD(P)+)
MEGVTTFERSADALELECDILIPAALEAQITVDNAPRVKARMVAEAANGPVTADADAILRERGICVVPDIYLNAGGVVVSYFEWIKNLSHVRFGRMERRFEQQSNERILRAVQAGGGLANLGDDEIAVLSAGSDEAGLVSSGLEDTMALAYHELRDTQRQHPGIDLRTAAFVVALRKIARSYSELGIFP